MAATDDVEDKVADHLVKNGDDLHFTRWFWKGCEPLPRDVAAYSKFAGLVSDYSKGIKIVPEGMGVGLGSSVSWATQTTMPKLGHYLTAFIKLGTPGEGMVWLTMECTHGQAIPVGPFLQVPSEVRSWRDIEQALAQIGSPADHNPRFSKAYLFGFLVGIIIGDAHKPKQGHSHRHINVTLSKRYETNLSIGDFATYCANQLGLRMERKPDLPKPEDKPYGFYVWASQSSPFVDWIFNVVLGLEDGQHTTYDAVRMDWAFEAPLDFRLGIIHGIAESDGSVSVASQTVEFWVIPDWDFMIKLLATFGLKGFRNREAVSLVKTQATDSFRVPVFAAHLRTTRYALLELMATTRKLDKKERIPSDVRQEIVRLAAEGWSIPKIIVEIARTRKLLVSFEAGQRWARKSGKYQPKSRQPSKEENIT